MKVILSIWHLIVGEPNAAKAVSSMQKAIVKLEKAVNWQHLKAEAKAEAAKLAAEAEKLARDEAAKADRIFKKLQELIS